MEKLAKYSPKEKYLATLELGGGVALLLDRETCQELGLALPMRGWKFKPTRIAATKRKKWLSSLGN